ncbi:RlmE family RNA methyltransferase [Ferrovibrio sp.]|uniref:RlmE family RNA methyltransferase n=1 Tax=Ferrovibrio sp. TaxID=1917215 RepID=UPI0025BEBE93|nr:RlmE family RNA methyltransferase [Ferrovibrio sp.]MBX3456332.1 RlmE family RNA methyltransferase [Ferrovibrio sp.]
MAKDTTGRLHVTVKSGGKRKLSSKLWLERQLNDPYVAQARREGFRSRAAYKLQEIDDKHRFLKPGQVVVDLGAAPGGWSQVAIQRVKAGEKGGGSVLAVDINPMPELPGATVMQLDFLSEGADAKVIEALGGPVDVVLSDMASPATGHRQTDHIRIMSLCEAALDLARRVLAPGGGFVAKVLRGGTENELLNAMKRDFRTVRHVKPPASRADSAESYVIATGFRGDSA